MPACQVTPSREYCKGATPPPAAATMAPVFAVHDVFVAIALMVRPEVLPTVTGLMLFVQRAASRMVSVYVPDESPLNTFAVWNVPPFNAYWYGRMPPVPMAVIVPVGVLHAEAVVLSVTCGIERFTTTVPVDVQRLASRTTTWYVPAFSEVNRLLGW